MRAQVGPAGQAAGVPSIGLCGVALGTACASNCAPTPLQAASAVGIEDAIGDIREITMSLIVLLIILLLLFGGGGFYLGGPAVGGSLGTIILVILIVMLVSGKRL